MVTQPSQAVQTRFNSGDAYIFKTVTLDTYPVDQVSLFKQVN
ncbi:MAG TPA: hypothetical protein VF207_07455 [Chthoniobacterales bacterium]